MDQTVFVIMKVNGTYGGEEMMDEVLDIIAKFTRSDFKVRGRVSGRRDEADAIITGLNALGEELESRSFYLLENEKRINEIMDTLLQYTLMDFSKKIPVSEKGDELDAIIVGLNTLSEELESNMSQLKESEAALQKKTVELARSNRELEQFAYVASHDLQEPLRMVSSFLQLLEKHLGSNLDRDAKEYIGFAVDGSLRMKDMINDLLTYSRILSGNAKFENTDIGELLADVKDNLKESISESKVTIGYETMPTLFVDRIKMTRLFQNLVGNAIKFRSKDRPAEIHIKCEQLPETYLFSVRDNGIGIKREYYGKIFLIFQRLNSKNEYPGTGIGLAECQKIAELHMGKIWLESEEGKGSVFYFTVPKYLR